MLSLPPSEDTNGADGKESDFNLMESGEASLTRLGGAPVQFIGLCAKSEYHEYQYLSR